MTRNVLITFILILISACSANNTISQTAMGMTPQQIRNSNASSDGFISNAY